MPFTHDELAALDQAKEVRIETSAGPDQPIHKTIIWLVVDGEDVFVRSWRGVTARWYREALANPEIALHVGKQRLAATAVPAHDVDAVTRTSAALERKYAGDPSTRSMVRDEILITTLRIDPRSEKTQ
ncbi:MAG TPA: nitroreductase/quinone reductase family protein [Candidatus Limnocylindrales bacterium]|nr:nitroreductase/quinone reductase family protein [Candidatus Limnocylindrales bacterium]